MNREEYMECNVSTVISWCDITLQHHAPPRLQSCKPRERSSLFATQQLIGMIYPRAVLDTEYDRDYVRERVTNYRQLPQVQWRTLFSFSLSQSIRTILLEKKDGCFPETARRQKFASN